MFQTCLMKLNEFLSVMEYTRTTPSAQLRLSAEGRSSMLRGQRSQISKITGSPSTRTSFLYLVSDWWSYSPMYRFVRNRTTRAEIECVM